MFEFEPPLWCHERVKEVELSFLVSPHELVVGLAADRRGPFRADRAGHFRMGHDAAARADWHTTVGAWLNGAVSG